LAYDDEASSPRCFRVSTGCFSNAECGGSGVTFCTDKGRIVGEPRVPEVMQKQELKKLAKTYGKFWCTWQFDRGTISSPHNEFGIKFL